MSKHLVITGGTSGIGQAAIESLVRDEWEVTILARNQKKVQQLKDRYKEASIEGIVCDLASLSSVKSAARELLGKRKKIDVLMNNAGGIFQKRNETIDGLEMTFEVNHLSHFLLTTELMDQLIADKTRIINVSSAAHRMGKIDFEDLQWERTKYNSMKAYSNGKLCNIYFAQELHRRFGDKGVTAFACHPGVVKTNFAGDFGGFFSVLLKAAQPFMITAEKGALTQLHLATNDSVTKHSGRYFEKQRLASVAPQALDQEAAAQLWEISEQLVADFR
jgi:NAD(P)-dependent dehydrogenase (short-subunit alcohol dehydrogenase family)